jgi:predicted ATPase
LVIKIDADHGDNGEAGKSLFIGREKEINEIIEDVKSNKGTRLLLVGESGIGKTALLDEIHRILGDEEKR